MKPAIMWAVFDKDGNIKRAFEDMYAANDLSHGFNLHGVRGPYRVAKVRVEEVNDE